MSPAWIGLLLALLAPADSVRLRVRLVDGFTVHRIFQVHSRLTVLEAGAAGRARETADIGGMRQVLLSDADGHPVLHLAFDSLRTLAREGAGPWRGGPVAGTDTLWVQARIDERLRVLERRARGSHRALGMLPELATAVPELALPSTSVSRGSRWTEEALVPVGAFLSRDTEIAVPAHLTFVVDSIAARSADTLVYVRVTGRLGASTAAADGGAGARYGGTLSGAWIWSTAWNAIVSHTTKIVVTAEVGAASGGPSRRPTRITLETTVRAQVRGGS